MCVLVCMCLALSLFPFCVLLYLFLFYFYSFAYFYLLICVLNGERKKVWSWKVGGGGKNLGELSSEYNVLYIKKPFYFQLKSLNTQKSRCIGLIKTRPICISKGIAKNTKRAYRIMYRMQIIPAKITLPG